MRYNALEPCRNSESMGSRVRGNNKKNTVSSEHTTAIDREDGDSSATSEYSESGGSGGSEGSGDSGGSGGSGGSGDSGGSGGSGGSSWSNSEKVGELRGGSLRQELTVASRCRVRGRRDPPVAKSAPSSFRKRETSGGGGGGQSSSSTTSASTGFARSVANGLKLAQTQAIAVAGFLADVDSRYDRVCVSCLSHRASYHGRGD